MPYTRRMSIGGSDVGAILGIDEYRSPRDVWDSLQEDGYRQEDNEQTIRGRAMEDVIAQEAARTSGAELQVVEEPIVDPVAPWLHARPDRAIVRLPMTDVDGPGALECKAHNSWMIRQLRQRIEEEEGQGNAACRAINPSYYAQIQHYLGVTGWKWGVYATLDYDKWEIIWIPVPRDDAAIGDMRRFCEAWWERHIVNGEPPADQPREQRREQRREWPRPNVDLGEVTRTDGPWMDAVNELKVAKETLDLAKHGYAQAQDRVKELMGETPVVNSPIARIVWRESTRYSYDIDALVRDYSIADADTYRIVKVSRDFRPTFR